MKLDRRQLMAGAAAGAVAAIPGVSAAQAPGKRPIDALFDTLFFDTLRLNPEGATNLGLDRGDNADLRAKLSDEGPAGRAAARALTQRQIAQLEAFPV
ncbi:MAG: DUF885 domain-containing protein, partial [Sphingomonas sp.]|nr:DUF885 domain-containing protein [Sphingomonas sp.]